MLPPSPSDMGLSGNPNKLRKRHWARKVTAVLLAPEVGTIYPDATPPPRSLKPAGRRRFLDANANKTDIGNTSLIISTLGPGSLNMSTDAFPPFFFADDGRLSSVQVGRRPEALLRARCTSTLASLVKEEYSYSVRSEHDMMSWRICGQRCDRPRNGY